MNDDFLQNPYFKMHCFRTQRAKYSTSINRIYYFNWKTLRNIHPFIAKKINSTGLTWIFSSHALSREAVASSKQTTLGRGIRKRARARHRSWRCPADRHRPLSPTSVARKVVASEWDAMRPHLNNTSDSCSSEKDLIIQIFGYL